MTPRGLTEDDREKSSYLGDGLYVRADHGVVILFATNGVVVHDEVFLEPSVLKAFKAFIAVIENSENKSVD